MAPQGGCGVCGGVGVALGTAALGVPWSGGSPHREAVPPQMAMDSNEVLPRHFDAATKWPGMIHEPLDQGNCAGSWAFSTAGEMQWVWGWGLVGQWDGTPGAVTIPDRRARPQPSPPTASPSIPWAT